MEIKNCLLRIQYSLTIQIFFIKTCITLTSLSQVKTHVKVCVYMVDKNNTKITKYGFWNKKNCLLKYQYSYTTEFVSHWHLSIPGQGRTLSFVSRAITTWVHNKVPQTGTDEDTGCSSRCLSWQLYNWPKTPQWIDSSRPLRAETDLGISYRTSILIRSQRRLGKSVGYVRPCCWFTMLSFWIFLL